MRDRRSVTLQTIATVLRFGHGTLQHHRLNVIGIVLEENRGGRLLLVFDMCDSNFCERVVVLINLYRV